MKNKVQISLMERRMYRNLLVNVPTERSPRPVIDGGAGGAAGHGASCTGEACTGNGTT